MQSQSEDANNNAHGDRGKGDDNTCRDFMRGVCNRGNKCKYYHPPSGGPNQKQDLAMICRDYQNGKCNRSTCKYLHITNAEEKIYLQTGQLPPRSERRGRPSYNDYGEEPTRAGKSDPVCKDFLNKVCKRGSNCKFRHVMEDDYYGGPPSYGYEPPRKRLRDGYNGYGGGGGGGDDYLMQENESLRRKISDLQKQIGDLKGANEVLLEQNARLRNERKGDDADKSYSSGYNSSAYSQGAYNAGSSAGYSGSSAYEGYTKFE